MGIFKAAWRISSWWDTICGAIKGNKTFICFFKWPLLMFWYWNFKIRECCDLQYLACHYIDCMLEQIISTEYNLNFQNVCNEMENYSFVLVLDILDWRRGMITMHSLLLGLLYRCELLPDGNRRLFSVAIITTIMSVFQWQQKSHGSPTRIAIIQIFQHVLGTIFTKRVCNWFIFGVKWVHFHI